jgi:hypothetical protein
VQLWDVRLVHREPNVDQITGSVISGARGSGARFFDCYYKENTAIGKLSFLAAHIVLTAGRFQWDMIRGLDIVLFRRGEYHELSEEEKEPLHRRSKELNETIRTRLFAE